jgi:hypothetical protein
VRVNIIIVMFSYHHTDIPVRNNRTVRCNTGTGNCQRKTNDCAMIWMTCTRTEHVKVNHACLWHYFDFFPASCTIQFACYAGEGLGNCSDESSFGGMQSHPTHLIENNGASSLLIMLVNAYHTMVPKSYIARLYEHGIKSVVIYFHVWSVHLPF